MVRGAPGPLRPASLKSHILRHPVKLGVSTGPCHLSHIWIHAASVLANGGELLGGVEVRVLAKVTTDRPHGHQGQPPAPGLLQRSSEGPLGRRGALLRLSAS